MYALNNGKPVDIRDVMKGIGLSSPTSCAGTYRSLKTWEIYRKMNGEYTVKTQSSY
jgi:hypothetical protein